METKPKFTNSPANDFSTFAKRIQGKSKEEQEKIRADWFKTYSIDTHSMWINEETKND